MKDATRTGWAVIFFLAIACGFAGRALYDSIVSYAQQPQDETAAYAEAVEPFRPLLPRDASVGYVSDIIMLDNAPYVRAYYNVRYILSPVRVIWKDLLKWKDDCDYVIGVYGSAANLDAFLRQNGYRVMKGEVSNALNAIVVLLGRNPR